MIIFVVNKQQGIKFNMDEYVDNKTKGTLYSSIFKTGTLYRKWEFNSGTLLKGEEFGSLRYKIDNISHP